MVLPKQQILDILTPKIDEEKLKSIEFLIDEKLLMYARARSNGSMRPEEFYLAIEKMDFIGVKPNVTVIERIELRKRYEKEGHHLYNRLGQEKTSLWITLYPAERENGLAWDPNINVP